MKKLIILASIVLSGVAQADQEAQNVIIRDYYKVVTTSVPKVTQQCVDVQVSNGTIKSEPKGGGGVVLGGIIGNVLGAASGLGDGARTAGTVIGVIVGNEMSRENVPQGYHTERRCSNVTTYSDVSEEVYSHSTIRFDYNGRKHEVRFQR